MLWHLYLIECSDGSLYAGITTDVGRRFTEHLAGKGARYTRSHKPVRLVASRPVGSRAEALRAELALKRLPKAAKIDAFSSCGPDCPTIQPKGNSMNKSELVEAVAKGAELSKADAERAINAVVETIVKTVAKGGDVALIGFGSFKASKRAARTGKNPKTGEPLKIAATTVPKFSAGAGFKAAVAGKKAKKK